MVAGGVAGSASPPSRVRVRVLCDYKTDLPRRADAYSRERSRAGQVPAYPLRGCGRSPTPGSKVGRDRGSGPPDKMSTPVRVWADTEAAAGRAPELLMTIPNAREDRPFGGRAQFPSGLRLRAQKIVGRRKDPDGRSGADRAGKLALQASLPRLGDDRRWKPATRPLLGVRGTRAAADGPVQGAPSAPRFFRGAGTPDTKTTRRGCPSLGVGRPRPAEDARVLGGSGGWVAHERRGYRIPRTAWPIASLRTNNRLVRKAHQGGGMSRFWA